METSCARVMKPPSHPRCSIESLCCGSRGFIPSGVLYVHFLAESPHTMTFYRLHLHLWYKPGVTLCFSHPRAQLLCCFPRLVGGEVFCKGVALGRSSSPFQEAQPISAAPHGAVNLQPSAPGPMCGPLTAPTYCSGLDFSISVAL